LRGVAGIGGVKKGKDEDSVIRVTFRAETHSFYFITPFLKKIKLCVTERKR